MRRRTDVRAGTSYTFRTYESSDIADFLDLYAELHGERHDEAWFQWRYEDTPFLDHVPVFVAEADERVVATRPFLALPMVVGNTRALGLLTADTMVHPDHRRRGLFTSLTEAAVEYYEARDPEFVFNEPNAASRSGYLTIGWRELGPIETHYRVQNPRPIVESRYGVDPPVSTLLATTNGVVRTVADAVRRRYRSHTVRSFQGVRRRPLMELYDRRPPPEIHALRTEPYYDWRFSSPAWTRTTYVADDGRGLSAGLLARTRTTSSGATVTQIADVVPMIGDAARTQGLVALVGQVLADHRDSDIVAAPSTLLPSEALSPFGFHSDCEIPVKWFSAHDTTLCVRSLRTGACPWEIGGGRLDDPGRWRLGFGERDTA